MYCSNESPVNVYFDNLQVIHTKGPLLEETHYYPFGLTMSGISSKSAGSLANKNKYQTYELNTDLDLNLNESFFRTHDPQLGRFWQLDPKAADEISLYAAMDNNPISKTDFLGDLTKMYAEDGTYIGDIKTKKGKYATILSGDNVNGAVLIAGLIQQFNITDDKVLSILESAVQGVGDNYDVENFEKFWDQNDTKIGPFTNSDGETTTFTNNKFTDEQTKKQYKSTAELYGNLVKDGRFIKVGQGRQTDHSATTGSPDNLPDEKNKVSYIHTHPDGGNGTRYTWDKVTRDKNGKIVSYERVRGASGGFIGGGPSNTNDVPHSGKFNYRSVVVDANHVYLIQGDKKPIIIERHD